jgi:hypothetical protein
MKLIFLDFDGVLNSNKLIAQAFRSQLSDAPPTEEELQTLAKIQTLENDTRASQRGLWLSDIRILYPTLVGLVNQIIEATNAKVVLSTAWRKEFSLDVMRIFLEHHGFRGEIIDKTPSKMSMYSRLSEIALWLADASDNNITVDKFVILDDDPSPGFEGGFPDNFVNTNIDIGLTENDVSLAISILNKD